MSFRTMILAAAAAACLSTPLVAQSAASTSSAGVSAAPLLTRQSVGVSRIANAPAPAKNPAPFRADTKQNRALMIVGGAAMLTGAVVGHDAGVLISVGGAVVFLWGLYQYLQ
jgi:hypothetical protein